MPRPNGKDPYRGIDPERIDAFSRSLDRTTGEMFALAKSDKTLRGKQLTRLAEHARLLILKATEFSEEVEAAL